MIYIYIYSTMKIGDREALGRQKAKTVPIYSENSIMTAVVAFPIMLSTKNIILAITVHRNRRRFWHATLKIE